LPSGGLVKYHHPGGNKGDLRWRVKEFSCHCAAGARAGNRQNEKLREQGARGHQNSIRLGTGLTRSPRELTDCMEAPAKKPQKMAFLGSVFGTLSTTVLPNAPGLSEIPGFTGRCTP
jgi:hypothetical protein